MDAYCDAEQRRKAFARILVEELVDKKLHTADGSQWCRGSGINPQNLSDRGEIWRFFVRFGLETGGMKSRIVIPQYRKLPDNSLILNSEELRRRVRLLKGRGCYSNFTLNCTMKFKKDEGVRSSCAVADCPIVELTKELSWHRQHYKVAKMFAEWVRRFLVEDPAGTLSGNMNDVYSSTVSRYRNLGNDWQKLATEHILMKFRGTQKVNGAGKSATFALTMLTNPVHQLNHWADLNLMGFVPIDTHVARLAKRFGWVSIPSDENVLSAVTNLYPDDPRRLDFALYRLGAELEEDICRAKPDCLKCYQVVPAIAEACPVRH